MTAQCSSYIYTLLAVYTGDSLANLSPVASFSGYYAPAPVSFDAVAGVSYQIAVDTAPIYTNDNAAYSTWLGLTVVLQPPPANDNFANRTTIAGTNTTVNNCSNISATKEPGEPDHAGHAGGRSAWWTWTAPVSGRFAVAVQGQFNKLLAIYTGNDVAALTPLVATSCGSNDAAKVDFQAVAGTAYQIAVDGDNGNAATFTIILSAPPNNDDFADAYTISNTNVVINGTNAGATKEVGEAAHGGDAGGRSVWWNWLAPASGRAVITAKAVTGFTPTIGVYTGNAVSSLTTIAEDMGWSSTGPAAAVFDAVAGTTYRVAVDGEYGASGTFTLQAQFVTPPSNDNFADRRSLTNMANNVWYVTGSDVGATKEAGETPNGKESVWWTWTAPANGEVLIELESIGCSPPLNFPWLMVYQGSSLASLAQVYARVEFAGNQSYHDGRFTVTAGTTYQIWAATRASGPGNYYLRVTFEPPPPNDMFANRTVITNTPFLYQYGYVNVTGYNVSATKETGEPSVYFTGGKTVWWTWTAPGSGKASVVASPIRYVFSSMMSVSTGSAVNGLTRIASGYTTCTDGSTGLNFPVTSNTTYQIAVDGSGSYGDSGEIQLTLSINVDTNAPLVSISNLTSGQMMTSPGLTVNGGASDPLGASGSAFYSSGVQLVEVRLNGGVWQPAAGTNSWSLPLTLIGGPNTIEARSRDAVSNYSGIASVSVNYGITIAPNLDTSGIHFSFPTETNKTYQLEWAASLSPAPSWQGLDGTLVSGNGSTMNVCDTNCGAASARFYRLHVRQSQ